MSLAGVSEQRTANSAALHCEGPREGGGIESTLLEREESEARRRPGQGVTR